MLMGLSQQLPPTRTSMSIFLKFMLTCNKYSTCALYNDTRTLMTHSQPTVKVEETPDFHNASVSGGNGTLGGIRTPDRRIRSPMLYPTELPGHNLRTDAIKENLDECKRQRRLQVDKTATFSQRPAFCCIRQPSAVFFV